MRALLAAAVALAALLLVGTPARAQGYAVGVVYEGELIDGALAPLSGVFPLRFSLYEARIADEPVWTELRWLAVAEGRYRVTLGRETAIPASLDGQTLWLGVATRDGAEIVRQPFTVRHERVDGGDREPTVRRMTFADLTAVALRAERATRAQDCDRIEGRSYAQIDRYDSVLRRLRELEDEVRPGGSRIGSETTVLPRAGGAGGQRYEVACPPGFAATGARGGHAALVDSVQLVCTRLE